MLEQDPGVCVHHDDMPALLEQLRAADVWVFAMPLYTFTVPGLMKGFMDRTIPLLQPTIVQRGQHFTHPLRYPRTAPVKYVIISNCSFPERHHFSALEETFRRFTDSPDDELAGMICCAGGELLQQPALQDDLAWYPEAARAAGREIVQQGRISPQTQEILDRPLVDDPAIYANMSNAWWESLAPRTETGECGAPVQPATAYGTPIPPPQGHETMRDTVGGMAMGFSPREAGQMEAVIQFHVTGKEPGEYYLDIAHGRCRAYAGVHPSPSLTINTPSEVWLAIGDGRLNGAIAWMTGRYTTKGNVGLMMRFDKIFSTGAGK